MPHIDWQKLYEAAMLEMNTDKHVARTGAEGCIGSSGIDLFGFGLSLDNVSMAGASGGIWTDDA